MTRLTVLMMFLMLFTVAMVACSSESEPILSEDVVITIDPTAPLDPTATTTTMLPTFTPEPTSNPTATLMPTDVPDPMGETMGNSDNPPPAELQAFLSRLSDVERICVLQDGNIQQITAKMVDPLSVSQEESATALACLGADSLTALYLSVAIPADSEMLIREESTACIYDGLQSEEFDMPGLMTGGVSEEEAAKHVMATSLVLIYCSDDDTRAAMKFSLGVPPDEMRLMDCVVDSYDSSRELVGTDYEQLLMVMAAC